LYITKKKSEADFVVSISSDSDTKVAMVKDLKDPLQLIEFIVSDIEKSPHNFVESLKKSK